MTAFGAPSVLVVDDDEIARMLARRFLGEAGFDVSEAVDGESALEQLALAPPDAVLLDVGMPGIDGFEVCTRLRVELGLDKLPVVMLTAIEDVASVEQAYAAGATDFSTKPVNWVVLAHRLQHLLRSAETLLDLERARDLAALGSWSMQVEDGRMTWSPQLDAMLAPRAGSAERTWNELLALVAAADRPKLEAGLRDAINGEPCDVVHRLRRPDDGERVVRQRIGATQVVAGRAKRLWGVVQDITAFHRASEQARRMTYYDEITGLPNQTAFRDHLSRAVARAERHSCLLGVLHVELTSCAVLRDAREEHTADAVLGEAAARLLEVARTCDFVSRVDGDFGDGELARLCGDRFAVVLTDITTYADAVHVAARIGCALSRPHGVEEQCIDLGARIGVAVYPRDGTDARALVRHAEDAGARG